MNARQQSDESPKQQGDNTGQNRVRQADAGTDGRQHQPQAGNKPNLSQRDLELMRERIRQLYA